MTPYHRNIARSILKSPKFYFYDTGQVLGGGGIRLENLTACALLKEIHFQQDCYGKEMLLHYLRTKDGKEPDFLITRENLLYLMLEVKWDDDSLSKKFTLFSRYFPENRKMQLVKDLAREKACPEGCEIRLASSWLSLFSFS